MIKIVTKKKEYHYHPNGGLLTTDIAKPGFTLLHRGKVRDNYLLKTPKAEKFVSIATDKISAFNISADVPIPGKGALLSRISFFMMKWIARDLDIPVWIDLEYPLQPNTAIGKIAKPFPVEFVVRGMLTGSLYDKHQKSEPNPWGLQIPSDAKEFKRFAFPLFTPTEKSADDPPITETEIVARGLMTADQLTICKRYSLRIFEFCSRYAFNRGLILADSKFEFGMLPDGEIILIDEVCTPDSSRYYTLRNFETNLSKGARPTDYSKERFRQYWKAQGFGYAEAARYLDYQVKLEKNPAAKPPPNLILPPPLTSSFVDEMRGLYRRLDEMLISP